MSELTASPDLSKLIQDFFCQNLINQRNVSPQTIASYRDTFRLLLRYASERLKKRPAKMFLDDLDMSIVLGFLNHLESDRKNSIRTRNLRFAGIRSFMNYAAYRQPASLSNIQRVLSIPMKQFLRPVLGHLSRQEIEAVIQSSDLARWSGQRDRVMFTVFYNTGARVSEIIGLKIKDMQLGTKGVIHIRGKGRKERIVPLWKTTSALLKDWIKRIDISEDSPIFPNRSGKPLSSSGVEDRLRIAVHEASKVCPTLINKKVSPHTIRHTTAMHLLQSGVDLSVIALWLGHENYSTTHMYIEADITMKEQALAKLQETQNHLTRYKADDELLTFLAGL